jgi:hypothetical protein
MGPVSFPDSSLSPSVPRQPRQSFGGTGVPSALLVPEIAARARVRSTGSSAPAPAAVVSPRKAGSRVISGQGQGVLRTPERAAPGVITSAVTSPGGGRRSVLDNDLFMAPVKIPSSPEEDADISGSSHEKPVDPAIAPGSSTSPNLFLHPDQAQSSRTPSQRSSLVPPFPRGYTSAMPALPFPLKAAGEESPPPAIYDLTPPRGSDADEGDVRERGEDVEDEDGNDLEGFVVGEDDTEELVLARAQPRVSSDQTSASLSSLGQPIISRISEGGIPPHVSSHRSLSLGSEQRSPLTNSASSRGAYSEHWASSGSDRHRVGSQTAPVAFPLDPPRRHPSAGTSSRRRSRGGSSSRSPSFLNSSQSSGERVRPRAISMQDNTFGQQIPLPPVHGIEEGEAEGEEFGVITQPFRDDHPEFEDDLDGVVIGGSDEEMDSLGLLSDAPSRKSSAAALRSRASSLVSGSRSRRRGSTGTGSGTGSGVATQRPLSGTSTPHSTGSRTRAHTLAYEFTRSRHISGGSTAVRSSAPLAARRNSPTQTPTSQFELYQEDNTFGFSDSNVNWDSVPRLSSAPVRQVVVSPGSPPPLPLPSPDLVRALRSRTSRTSRTTAASEVTGSQAPGTEYTEASEISAAPSSYVTAAPTLDSMTITDGGSEGTTRSYLPLDYTTRDNPL